MTVFRLLILPLALIATACSSAEDPSKSVVRAAAHAAREAALEDHASKVSSRVVPLPPMKSCSVSIANGEPHGNLAHSLLQEATRAIEGTEGLSIPEKASSDLSLLLLRTERANPRDSVWNSTPSSSHASGAFYAAYVILDGDRRYLAGDLIKCNGEYKQCGERMATHTLRMCQAREA